MNTVFSIIRNAEFVKKKQYDVFVNSLKNLNSSVKVVILNSTSEELNKEDFKNCDILNISPNECDLNIYGSLLGYFGQIKFEDSDYILFTNVETTLFTRNPFDFFKHFKHDLFFYSPCHINAESEKNKVNYENYLKTCNFYLGNDFETFSIGDHFFAGKYNNFKALIFNLFMEVNRNSASIITTQAVLSYSIRHLAGIYRTNILNHNFYKKVNSIQDVSDLLENEIESRKQYMILYS